MNLYIKGISQIVTNKTSKLRESWIKHSMCLLKIFKRKKQYISLLNKQLKW